MQDMPISDRRSLLVFSLVAALAINGAYLVAFAAPTMIYVANVLVHALLGVIGTLVWAQWSRSVSGRKPTVSWALATGCVLSGVAMIVFGNPSSQWLVRTLHIVFATAAALSLLVFPSLPAFKRAGWWRMSSSVVVLIAVAIVILHQIPTDPDAIANNALAPVTLAGDAMAADDGPFFPSASETASGDTIPAAFFLGSKTCQRCHEDVFNEWKSSAHHFSSFNNQWYRKSIEYMQDVVGTTPPQWCAGCHDPALLFSGRMKQPVEDFIETEAAHAGLACVACHSITAIKSTRGNGGYVIEYPRLHDLVESENVVLRKLHDLVLRLDPGPHRSAFMRPFHKRQPAEFCQTCHKVSLDKPVNSYRWIRGFNTYDNWQASGVSGQGARSFYAPPRPLDCVSCHMPQVQSSDMGHGDGFVSSHRFAAANTALPTANFDSVQMDEVVRFMQAGALTIKAFALVASNVDEPASRESEVVAGQGGAVGRLASTFAAGEETSESARPAVRRDTLAISAPLTRVGAEVVPGQTYRLDVVTRSRIVGHFFPSGTVDAQEAWVEVEGLDADGRRFFWSGFVDDNGTVDPSAHFFKSLMIDGAGNPIDKRNAWAMRSVIYVNLIPPGAADIAHYRIRIPENTRGPIRFVARLNYRKFTDAYTKFAYAGEAAEADTAATLVSPDFDNRSFHYSADLSRVSGAMKSIPNPPIVVMASDSVLVSTAPASTFEHASEGHWEDWTDYGIGLLAEGDLRGSERAFRYATAADPDKPDSWVNLARVYLADERLAEAEAVLQRALDIEPDFHKAKFFRAMFLKASGEYREAVDDLDDVLAKFPRDRVALNQRARTLFLLERFDEAQAGFDAVLRIDSEDLMAHYNLMLVYRAVGDTARSREHESRYIRFKDDENTQTIARAYRSTHPHDNNEAQAIHEHISLWDPTVHAQSTTGSVPRR